MLFNYLRIPKSLFRIFWVFLFLPFIFTGCSNFFTGNQEFISRFERQQFTEALKELEPCLKSNNKDIILCNLEAGTVLFNAGRYRKAIDVFSRTEKMIKRMDYSNFGEDTVAMLTTDNAKPFRPFDYERIMVNVYLSLSYLLLGEYEDAVVESRRINYLIKGLKKKGLKNFEELNLAWYISALAYQEQGKLRDAEIDYSKVKHLPESLKNGEKVLIISVSWVPIKKIDYNREIPILKYRGYCGQVLVNGREAYPVENLISVASKNFKERIGWLSAKGVLRTALQGALALGVAKLTDSKVAGFASFLFMRALSSPDIRSWQSLPGCFYIYRENEAKQFSIKYLSNRNSKHLTIKPNNSKVSFVRLF